MVEVVRCDRPSGKAVPVPRPQCIEEGCTRPQKARGRCNACYCRWYGSPDFEYAPAPVVVPMPDPVCSWCGLFPHRPGSADDICPSCGFDAGEIAYAERILADSSAVLAEEVREFNARRRKGGT